MDLFVDCCQLSVCWRWGTCQVVMSPWRWMYHCFRTAGYNGKATRSVTVLHQAAAGSISGVAPASDKRESWRGREQEREGEWWVSHRKEKLGRERVSRGIEKEPVRVRPRSTSNQGHFLFFSPPLSSLFPTWAFSSLQDPMITGQLSKPLLSLRSNMSVAELRADDKAATPDSDLNDEPLLLPSEATDREGTPNKLYGKSTYTSRPSVLLHKAAGWGLGENWYKQRASSAGTGVSSGKLSAATSKCLDLLMVKLVLIEFIHLQTSENVHKYLSCSIFLFYCMLVLNKLWLEGKSI